MRAKLRDLRDDLFLQLDGVAFRLRAWDRRVFDALCGQTHLRRLSRLFVLATYFGDGYLWLLGGLILVLTGSSQDRRQVAVMAIITAINVILFRTSKRLTRRDRPEPLPQKRELRFRYLDSYSFPSGHATTSFGLAFMIAHFYPLWPVQLGVYGLAALIGFSRVYLGEHYPSDVIMGAVLGTLMSSLLLPLISRPLL